MSTRRASGRASGVSEVPTHEDGPRVVLAESLLQSGKGLLKQRDGLG